MNVNVHVECYHMETRTTTSTDSNGNTTTTTHTEKVVTFRDQKALEYGACVDRTPGRIETVGFNVVRLDSGEKHEWGDPRIASKHKSLHKTMYDDNKHRDTTTRVYDSWDIKGLEERQLVMVGTGMSMSLYR